MWQLELKNSLRTANDLVKAGFLAPEMVSAVEPVLLKYQFLLPRYYASLIDREDPHCPIGLQALPRIEELTSSDLADPLADLRHQPKPRLTHRFRGRVLLHLTPNCSMYCRFCFRKSLLNELKPDLFGGSLEEALAYIQHDGSIEEVIFSGGDPLMATDEAIRSVLVRLREVSTVQRIRFHTRVPVTFPMRITPELVEVLRTAAKPIVIVTHFNHPKELTVDSFQAVQCLKAADFTLLNQSVLMKGVNDSSEVLCDLSRKLFTFGILPYYLHQRDAAEGTDHFEVSIQRGKQIYAELKATLSGYLVPRYVQDLVGSEAKVEIS